MLPGGMLLIQRFYYRSQVFGVVGKIGIGSIYK
jgi:hypothetical protein